MRKFNLKKELEELAELENYYHTLVLQLRKKYNCEYFYYDKNKKLELLIHMKDRNSDIYNNSFFRKTKYIPFYYKNIKIEECWTQYY